MTAEAGAAAEEEASSAADALGFGDSVIPSEISGGDDGSGRINNGDAGGASPPTSAATAATAAEQALREKAGGGGEGEGEEKGGGGAGGIAADGSDGGTIEATTGEDDRGASAATKRSSSPAFSFDDDSTGGSHHGPSSLSPFAPQAPMSSFDDAYAPHISPTNDDGGGGEAEGAFFDDFDAVPAGDLEQDVNLELLAFDRDELLPEGLGGGGGGLSPQPKPHPPPSASVEVSPDDAPSTVGRLKTGSADDAAPAPPPLPDVGSSADGDAQRRRPRRILLLSRPHDEHYLSANLCFVRSQIEVFEATAEEAEARYKKGGMKNPVTVGRVGIRCIHCAGVPPDRRARGAVSYPNSIRLVHQAVRNWQRYHLLACEYIPPDLREKAEEYRSVRSHSGVASLKYWVESLSSMGLVDCGAEKGIRLEGNPPSSSLDEDDEDDEDEDKDEGEGEEDVDGDGDAPPASGSLKEPAASVSGLLDESSAASRSAGPSKPEAGAVGAASGLLIEPPTSPTGLSVAAAALGLRSPQEEGGGTTAGLAFPMVVVPAAVPSAHIPSAAAAATFEVPIDDAAVVASAAKEAPASVNGWVEAEGHRERLRDRVQLALDLVRSFHGMRLVPMAEGGTAGDGLTSPSPAPEEIEGDELVSLGVGLYEFFAGCHPFEEGGGSAAGGAADAASGDGDDADASSRKSRKRGSTSTSKAYTPLKNLGFPNSLCDVVSTLLDTKDGSSLDSYETFREVEEDMCRMVANPDKFLFDADMDKFSGTLYIPQDKIYGREKELACLMNSYDRVIRPGGACEVVMLSGYSGTGKSSLMRLVQGLLKGRSGYFISGKFDQLRQVQPLSAIVSAFNEYCDILLGGDVATLDLTRTAIRETLGPSAAVLEGLIPNLSKIIGQTDEAPPFIGQGKEAQNRLLFLFRAFARTIASVSHPLVLFLDDLQWADAASLELLRALITDPSISSLLFLGCYRDNEVDDSHPLSLQLSAIESSGVSVTTIKVGNLDKKSVNALVSENLCLSPRLTRPLAGIVYSKTSGNGLFVVQFLRSLFDEGLLRFSLSSRRWEWDIEAIRSRSVSDNVVGLMKGKMLRLPPEVCWWLKVAACFGSQCDTSTLKLLEQENFSPPEGTSFYLDTAVQEGLMSKVGSTYMFSHDQIQHAAYSLVDGTEGEALHLQIGRLLWEKTPKNELNNIIFLVVDQLHRGSNLIRDHTEKTEVAKLFLMAGEKAMSSCAFLPASIYLLQGIELLEIEDWERHYDLSLRLHALCAEAQYVTGNLDGLEYASKLVFQHARNLHDKIHTHDTVARSLGTQGKQLDALRYGLDVLAQLGEVIPNDVDESIVEKELQETMQMLEKTTAESIIQKEVLQDKTQIAAMKILARLIIVAYKVKPGLCPVLNCRMIKISLLHGVCKESACGFSSFGVYICGRKDVERAYRYGKLGLSLLERFKAKEYVAQCYSTVYSHINIYKEPHQACLPSLRHGHEVGMETGQIEWAVSCASVYTASAVHCGHNLETLTDEARGFMLRFQDLKGFVYTTILVPYFQAVLNLRSLSEDYSVTELTGDVMNQDDYLKNAVENRRVHVLLHIYYLRMWLAYLFGRYELAAERLEKLRRALKAHPERSNIVTQESFYAGLIAIAVVRTDKQSKLRPIIYDARGKLRLWTEYSSWNFLHKLKLLDAEIAVLDGDAYKAAMLYDDAIRVAGEHGFVHEQALACERAGIFHSECSSSAIANDYFSRSHQYYLQWGAIRKAKDISEHLTSID